MFILNTSYMNTFQAKTFKRLGFKCKNNRCAVYNADKYTVIVGQSLLTKMSM